MVGLVSQLSVAVMVVTSNVALPLLSSTKVADDGALIVGAVTSSIVTVMVSWLWLPASSSAVTTTEFWPKCEQSNAERL